MASGAALIPLSHVGLNPLGSPFSAATHPALASVRGPLFPIVSHHFFTTGCRNRHELQFSEGSGGGVSINSRSP